ncbi:MAG: hypothetical protein GWP14_07805 [Actinobacteria bacterium]|nr:hypothetical protein [Actinomycetota bacterium]
MGLVSTGFAVIASAPSTGVINTNNRRWAVINNVRQSLADAERSASVAAFADVAVLDDEDYADEMAKQNGCVAVVWLKDQEYDAADTSGNRVTIVNLLVAIYARKNTDQLGHKADVLRELATLADIAANALYSDTTRGGNAEYVQYGTSSSLDGTEISEYEITDQQSPNWAKAQLTVHCGYYHSDTGR